ncbi:MAG: hypothetical protein VYB86_02885 [Candidatus Thermoplasmatota archaeon]|jgi:hypothetical protein|nr:hypothetical protein [Candidatus Thermoplasmatota archaeon]|tara:strand:- start:1592 stop:2320 length:729 start_codon:yes stop_codon:yes gene_type:complete
MPDDEETEGGPSGMPLPPLPPGIAMPPPPPPPPLPDESIESAIDENPPLPTLPSQEEESESNDFQAHWEKRKLEESTESSGNRDSMYGHIDRISSGQVGTLLDRFSDRFGSELDREIIVLRKKQQQDMLAIKPIVELISAPESDDDAIEESEDDEFPEFFSIVNELLGNMPEEFVQEFIESESFELFQNVGEDPSGCDHDTRSEFFTMINSVLGDLPESEINDFVASPGFQVFQRMSELYGE